MVALLFVGAMAVFQRRELRNFHCFSFLHCTRNLTMKILMKWATRSLIASGTLLSNKNVPIFFLNFCLKIIFYALQHWKLRLAENAKCWSCFCRKSLFSSLQGENRSKRLAVFCGSSRKTACIYNVWYYSTLLAHYQHVFVKRLYSV